MTVDTGLQGKTAIVTGGARGIGRATVELLAAEGVDVTFFYLASVDAAREVVEIAREVGHRVAAVQVDVRDREACEAAVDEVVGRSDRMDILVNNSGVIRDGLLAALSDEDLSAVLDTNVGGLFNVTRAVVPHMVARRCGRIINVSSVAAEKGGRGQSNYAASKGAVNAVTRSLAVELAPRGIMVNAVAPGVIATDMSRDVLEAAPEEVASRILLRRPGTPLDVAHAIRFLASDQASYITGEVLHVDGGFKME